MYYTSTEMMNGSPREHKEYNPLYESFVQMQTQNDNSYTDMDKNKVLGMYNPQNGGSVSVLDEIFSKLDNTEPNAFYNRLRANLEEAGAITPQIKKMEEMV